ncbi:ABC transporter substrate-binding protein [Halotalea alkalilenta]|uniref:ABC transporter substrate-binding protein n=1 Tax=Halotalea alkalilenta TaxID=376489 RepID=A0A172YDM4_9GAMM|nr:ABC transporter substrate-binding protein [Halotalea alkalilenta]ANF57337.1 ABC transporter substrate-binding protein [Halotalea alkalilenta]
MKAIRCFHRLGRCAAVALLASVASTSAALAQTTITAVMHSPLRVLDPVMSTAHITRNHSYMIYDVLVAADEEFTPRPQMASWTTSDDGLVYTFTLRDGLKFHDGAPVRAADAVASLKRWGQRDGGGQILMDFTSSLEAVDDKTLVWQLREPFPALLDTLAKQSGLPPFIMPERIALTASETAISEHIGSGPFRFIESEFQPGVSVAYEKFEDYVPREEPASWMAGGKVVNVDKVVWVTMPDALTSVNALAAGEIDYLEQVPVDLVPMLESEDEVTVEVRSDLGYQNFGRMNFKHPPFDDVRLRQAALLAMDQQAILSAQVGDPRYYTLCGAIFGCGTALEDQTGAETLLSGGDQERARALLEEAGYDGTPVVILHATDVVSLSTQPIVAAQALRQVGFNVEVQSMDWQTLISRRVSMAPPAQGGWNMFFSTWIVPEINTPLVSSMLSGRGDTAFFGWPDDPVAEEIKMAYIRAETAEAQREAALRFQQHAMEQVLYIPLGEFGLPQARRNTLANMIPSPVPVFWNIEKNE